MGIEPVPGQGQASSVGMIEPVPGTGTARVQRGYIYYLSMGHGTGLR